MAHGTRVTRRKAKRADYLISYTRDGDPAFATQEEIDESGQKIRSAIEKPEEPESEPPTEGVLLDTLSPSSEERAGVRSRKYEFDGGQVEIAAEIVHELDADGKQLRVVKLTDYTTEKVRTLCASPDELRARWADAGQRADILQQLADRGIDFPQVATQASQPDGDPFDLLCHLAFQRAHAHPPAARRPRETAASRLTSIITSRRRSRFCATCWKRMPATANPN